MAADGALLGLPLKFDLLTPCVDCPFRVGAFQGLHPDFVEEMTENALGNPGRMFACHKTTTEGGAPAHQEQHCAGALIFSEKHEHATQMMRIMERIGQYDRTKLVDPGDVFENSTEMVDAYR